MLPGSLRRFAPHDDRMGDIVDKVNNRALGQVKEDYACEYLVSKGYKILERNWHWSNRGEIDIIAVDPKRFGEEYLIFIEVKFRNESMLMSLQAVNQKKIAQLKLLAKAFLQSRKLLQSKVNISFDFIAIHGKEIEHIKNIVD